MTATEWALIILAELAVLLLALLLFALWDRRRRQSQMATLVERVQTLRGQVKQARVQVAQLQQQVHNAASLQRYDDWLDQRLQETREHHAGLGPDRDIALDLGDEASQQRRAAALRHAFLVAEKQACQEEQTDWSVLAERLQQMIEFLQEQAVEVLPGHIVEDEPADTDASDSTELETLRKRVANLEGFKKLYFELEEAWQRAQQEAEQSAAEWREEGDGDVEALLERYRQSYASVEEILLRDQPSAGGGVDDSALERPSVGKMVIANQEEVQRLRNMAVDQHKVIEQLKRQLLGASSAEDKERLITEMAEQLERQKRFLKESETCTELLEKELNAALERKQELEVLLQQNPDSIDSEEIHHLETLVEDLTDEGRNLLESLAAVSEDNHKLRETGSGDAGGDGSLREELDALRMEYAQLEERYLSLKQSG